MRREVQIRLGIKAVDIYGLSEILGPGVATECEAQEGLHGWEDHFLFETIDPDTGKPVPRITSYNVCYTKLLRSVPPGFSRSTASARSTSWARLRASMPRR